MGNTQMYVNGLSKASLYNPNFIDPQIELAKFYEENKEYDKASNIYLTILQQNPQLDPRLKLDAARNLWLADKAPLAKLILSQVLEERTLDANTYNEARALLDKILINEHQQKYGLLPKNELQKKAQEKDTSLQEQPVSIQRNLGSQISNPEIPQNRASNEALLADVDHTAPKKPLFYIQLATFSTKTNADKFKSRLEEVTDLKNLLIVEKDGFYRVMVGP